MESFWSLLLSEAISTVQQQSNSLEIFQHWLSTPAGAYLLAWESQCIDAIVADIFGYNSMQLGLPELDALRCNRMPHRWLALPEPEADACTMSFPPKAALITDFTALPFPEASLDLVVLPHTLELSHDPHTALNEVARILVPEGKVIICGLNPTGLWAMNPRCRPMLQKLWCGSPQFPHVNELIGHWRLRDWLRLLSFDIDSAHFGCYRPAFKTQTWLRRFAWLDTLGPRWWPILGSAYCLTATKRVRGMRIVGKVWKTARTAPGVTAPAINRHHP